MEAARIPLCELACSPHNMNPSDDTETDSMDTDDAVESKGVILTGGASVESLDSLDSQISRLLSQEAEVLKQMIEFLKSDYAVDDTTIARVRQSNSNAFLMTMLKPGKRGSGICLASRAWLEWCGLGDVDVAWKQPKELLQGRIRNSQIEGIMPDFFTGNSLKQRMPQEPYSFLNVVNYRRVWDSSGDECDGRDNDDEFLLASERKRKRFGCRKVPFKFTLTIKRLRSDETGEFFPIFESIMTDERDLTKDEIRRLTAQEAKMKADQDEYADSSDGYAS